MCSHLPLVSPGGRPPQYTDLEALQYTTQAVKEVLRLYPAIPIFPREAAAADRLPSGHRVDAGAHQSQTTQLTVCVAPVYT